MKLRIRGNSLRLRLTRPEVEALLAKGVVEEATTFPGGTRFLYAVELSTSTTALCDAGGILVRIDRATGTAWCSSEDVSIAAEIGPLNILVEKDFACLNPRANEDPSKQYPHPGKPPSTRSGPE